MMRRVTEAFVRRFVAEHSKVLDARVRARYGMLEGWLSVAVNSVLFAVKLVVGLMLNSIAIIADAVHTFSDTLTSAIVIISFRISGKPADEDHPYGHGRAEYIATLVIAVLLFVTGIEFIRSGIERLLDPVTFEMSWPMLVIIGLTVLVKEALGQVSKQMGEMIDSRALEADFWHHRSDAISSLVVLAAMVATPLGFPWMDAAAAILVSFFLFYTGYDLARDAADSLLGQAPDAEFVKIIRDTAGRVPGVLGAHDIVVHSYGQNRFVGMHIEIDAEVPPMEAHDITDRVENLIHRELGAHCTVHYDPIQVRDPRVRELRQYLSKLNEEHEHLSGFHDVRILDSREFHYILFDMATAIDPGSEEIRALKTEIRNHIGEKYPDFTVKINITPIFKAQGV